LSSFVSELNSIFGQSPAIIHPVQQPRCQSLKNFELLESVSEVDEFEDSSGSIRQLSNMFYGCGTQKCLSGPGQPSQPETIFGLAFANPSSESSVIEQPIAGPFMVIQNVAVMVVLITIAAVCTAYPIPKDANPIVIMPDF
jgi:hypothetical protein